ncbi:MAG TPA: polysaccharide pyruvyl transferase family protein [Solirubrobacteraceae bacterium]|nr:polysaccharide pyruvyl transferase family protein [Solirubrobacteraceae bacterium]
MAKVVGLVGSYGGLNAGDEAILTVAIAQLRAAVADLEIVVFSRDPKHTKRHHDVERVVAPDAVRDDLLAEIRRTDLMLLGGGGILYDREADFYLRLVRLAQDAGVATATYAVGAGPLDRRADRRSVAEALNEMQLVTVRETAAKRLLEESGVECEIVVTADPALLLEPEPFTQAMLEREGLSEGQRLIGMSVREGGRAMSEIDIDEYHALLANAADFMVDRFDAQVVFVPIERRDIREAHRVIGRMGLPERAWVLKRDYGPRELRGLMEHLQMAVGMRLHFLLFAATAGVPVAALPYATKVRDFLDSLDVRSPDPERAGHAGALLSHIDRLWDRRDRQVEHIRKHLSPLDEAARENVRLIVDLLESRAPAAAS